MNQSTRKAILIAWLIVGTLDITGATIHYLAVGNKNPVNILVYIASGIVGKQAFEIGPPSMAVLGLALHYFIAFCWTVIFFTIYPRISAMSRNRVVTGFAYGVVIWTIMSQVVVPLSMIGRRPFNLSGALIGAGILCVAIGIPLSFMAYRHFNGKPSA